MPCWPPRATPTSRDVPHLHPHCLALRLQQDGKGIWGPGSRVRVHFSTVSVMFLYDILFVYTCTCTRTTEFIVCRFVAHEKGDRPASIKGRRPVFSSVEMFLWRNYLIFVSCTAPPSTSLHASLMSSGGDGFVMCTLCVCVCVCVRARVCAYMRVCVCVCVCVHTCMHTCVCCLCTCTYACVCLCLLTERYM